MSCIVESKQEKNWQDRRRTDRTGVELTGQEKNWQDRRRTGRTGEELAGQERY